MNDHGQRMNRGQVLCYQTPKIKANMLLLPHENGISKNNDKIRGKI